MFLWAGLFLTVVLASPNVDPIFYPSHLILLPNNFSVVFFKLLFFSILTSNVP